MSGDTIKKWLAILLSSIVGFIAGTATLKIMGLPTPFG